MISAPARRCSSRARSSPTRPIAASSLNVTEIWVASAPEWVDGVFTLVHDNGIRCVGAPCPSLTEKKLNSNLSAQIIVDRLRSSGADRDAIDRARDALYGDGLVVVGYRDYDSARRQGPHGEQVLHEGAGSAALSRRQPRLAGLGVDVRELHAARRDVDRAEHDRQREIAAGRSSPG